MPPAAKVASHQCSLPRPASPLPSQPLLACSPSPRHVRGVCAGGGSSACGGGAHACQLIHAGGSSQLHPGGDGGRGAGAAGEGKGAVGGCSNPWGLLKPTGAAQTHGGASGGLPALLRWGCSEVVFMPSSHLALLSLSPACAVWRGQRGLCGRPSLPLLPSLPFLLYQTRAASHLWLVLTWPQVASSHHLADNYARLLLGGPSSSGSSREGQDEEEQEEREQEAQQFFSQMGSGLHVSETEGYRGQRESECPACPRVCSPAHWLAMGHPPLLHQAHQAVILSRVAPPHIQAHSRSAPGLPPLFPPPAPPPTHPPALQSSLLGCMALTHGDDSGLQLPPELAPVQVSAAAAVELYQLADRGGVGCGL